MPIHLLCWSGAKTDSTANEAVPAVADLAVTRGQAAGTYKLPYNCTLLGAFAMNDTIARARVNYPSLRDLGLPEIAPLIPLAEPSANFNLCLWGANGPAVRQGEEIGIETSNGASTVDVAHAGLWLSTGITPTPAGRRFTVRGTALQTLIASQWTSAQIALDQGLPTGRYAIIGLRVVCNDGVAARLALPNSLQFRPGVVCGETIAIDDPRQPFRMGQFGSLGEFDQDAPPSLEILGGTAGAETPAVYLDLVEMRRGS